MIIAHLTSVHPRFDTRIYFKMCCSLTKLGKVYLVCADGKRDEVINNVNILDVGKSKHRIQRMVTSVNLIYKKAINLDADIYHLHDPELIPIGLKLKNLGKKVIFDIHENTDLQILEKDWIPLIFRKLTAYIYRKYEDYACKKYDLLIVPQEAMYKKYNKLSKTIVISNFPKKNNKLNLELKELNKYSLLYAGAISESRGLFNMLNLIEELNLIDNKYRLTLAGVISLDLLEKSKLHKGWKHTEYLGFLTKEEIQEVYARNSIGLILFNNVGQSKMIAKQIHTLNKEQMTQIGEDNIQKVDKYFSWDSQEIKLFKTYNEVINVK